MKKSIILILLFLNSYIFSEFGGGIADIYESHDGIRSLVEKKKYRICEQSRCEIEEQHEEEQYGEEHHE